MEYSNNSENPFLDFLLRIVKWKWILILFTIIGTCISVLIAFLLPNEYLTSASIRGSGGQGMNIGSMLKGTNVGANLGPLLDFAVPGGGGETDYYAAILSSRSLQDSLINKYNLKERYEVKKIEDAREILKSKTEIKKNGPAEIVFLEFYDESPNISFQITTDYVNLLNSIYARVSSENARNTRYHLEGRYKEIFLELTAFEDSLKLFQEKYGVFDIYVQTEAAVKSAASLKSTILVKEIELSSKKSRLGHLSPEVGIVEKEVEELKKNYREIINGNDKSTELDIFIPFKKTPHLGLSYLRLYRKVQIYNELIKVLLPLLEQAKIQELRETPSIVVIDHPILPEKKSRPKRALIVLLGTLSSFFLVLGYAFTRENLNKVKSLDPKKYAKILEIYEKLISFRG